MSFFSLGLLPKEPDDGCRIHMIRFEKLPVPLPGHIVFLETWIASFSYPIHCILPYPLSGKHGVYICLYPYGNSSSILQSFRLATFSFSIAGVLYAFSKVVNQLHTNLPHTVGFLSASCLYHQLSRLLVVLL